MKALVIEAPRRAAVREIPLPPLCGDMVRIQVRYAGLCATDLAIYTGECSFVRNGLIRYPVRPGHEYAGVVAEVGPEVTKFRPGDRVFSDCAVTCGKCPACREGRFEDCPEVRSLGTVNTWDGCFAEFQDMPERHVHPLPDGVSLEEGALIEPAAVAYDAFRGVSAPVGTVAVIGAGPIGMSAAWIAKNFGAGRVVMIGRNAGKLAVAEKIGADVTVDLTAEDPVAAVKKFTGGRGADLVVEATGAETALKLAIELVRVDGRVSLAGFFDHPLREFAIDEPILKGIALCGAKGHFGHAVKVGEMMAKVPGKLAQIITHRVKFADCLEFFEHEEKYHKAKIKVLLEF
ncbi:MAG: alcohol dehydrogenase catalytic domain-containing protein [Lentisphaeria bacterium]|nr:alcohol dehydrogenase catalytic domain-containing protein [Lentisphaeria bacterium]